MVTNTFQGWIAMSLHDAMQLEMHTCQFNVQYSMYNLVLVCLLAWYLRTPGILDEISSEVS